MLRTMTTLRLMSWSLLAGLAMNVALVGTMAQEPLVGQPKDPLPPLNPLPPLGKGAVDLKDGKEGKLLVVQINVTKTIGMTRAPGAAEDPLIEKVHNENPKICKVQAIFNDPRHILVTGVSPGTSKITLTGSSDPTKKDSHDEVIEIRVPSDDEPVREQQRRDYLELVKRAVPTANIDAIVAPNNVVILTGWVATAETVPTLLDAARSIFGTNVILSNGMRVGGVQQVQIDATICVVNRSKLRNMTFSWAINRRSSILASVLGPGTLTNAIAPAVGGGTISQAATGANLFFGVVGDNSAFLGFLEALRTDNMAKVQSEPKIVTLSGRPAQFISGGETPLLTSNGNGAPSVSYKSFGTTLTVLPIVLGNGKIHLEVAPVLSALDPANGITIAGANNTVVPGFTTRGAQVAVQMEDGQTVAIGGLIQHTTSGSIRKVPILGDIPFLGAAFSSKNYEEREEELIILVTPRLIDPMACNQLPERLPTRLTRTPDDFEFYLEGLLELPRGPRQICGPDGKHYTAGYKNGPTASVFPCGDQGKCGSGPGFTLGGKHGCKSCGPVCQPGCAGSSNGSCASNPVMMPAQAATRPPVTTTTGFPVPALPPGSVTIATPPTQLPSPALTPTNYVPEMPNSAPALRLPSATGGSNELPVYGPNE